MWMTMSDVMADLGVARSTIDKWRACGKGPRFKKLPNGELRLKRSEYEEWLERLPEAA